MDTGLTIEKDPEGLESQLLNGYWKNLYDGSRLFGRMSYDEFIRNPWARLADFGAGHYGWGHLPLLPSQKDIRAKLDTRGIDKRAA